MQTLIFHIFINCNFFTWQFISTGILFIIIVAAVTLAVNHLLLSTPLKREKKLHLQMAENSKSYSLIIANLKDKLEKLTIEKEQKEQLIAIVIHDLKSPLRFLSMNMQNLQENLKGMNPEDLKSYTLLLKNTVTDIYLFTEDVLLWLNNQKGDILIIKKNTNIPELIRKTSRIYKDIFLSKNNQLTISISEDMVVDTASDLLNVILRNLLDNANKFTTNGIISISAGIKEKSVFITVTDTGIGMDQEKSNALINNDLDGGEKQPTRKHLGYKIINDLVIKLGGSINITSELKKGTSVTILIPA